MATALHLVAPDFAFIGLIIAVLGLPVIVAVALMFYLNRRRKKPPPLPPFSNSKG